MLILAALVENEAVDAAQIAVPFGIIHAAADDKLIGDVEADIGHRQVESDSGRFAQQGAERQACRAALLQIEDAKAVCRRCDVVDQCLQWALESGQDAGVWGGMSEDERRALKRRAARARSRMA